MAKVLDMPKLSPTMEEGVLSTWHKKEGDAIGVDDLLAEVETDKATMEFRAFDKGVLLKLLVAAGATVKLGQPVAVVGAAGEDISALLAELGTAAPAGASASTPPHDAHDAHEARYESSPHVAAQGDAPAAADDGYRSVEVDDEDEESGAKTALLPPYAGGRVSRERERRCGGRERARSYGASPRPARLEGIEDRPSRGVPVRAEDGSRDGGRARGSARVRPGWPSGGF